MSVEVITREDLQLFRVELLDDLKEFIRQVKKDASGTTVEGYKTKQVRKILDCSINKLQWLRISGRLGFRKVGGTIYYKREDVEKLLSDGC